MTGPSEPAGPPKWVDPGRLNDRGLSVPLLDGMLRGMIERENLRQLTKWGVQNHDPAEWGSILGEEIGELFKEINRVQFPPYRAQGNLADETIQAAVLLLKIAKMAEA